ncbi:hypothetical protein [Candidatus Palauibacter sp.]|uniref:hypothetical protein n=1 Tax=Candidatus Palauibacter sp. TaxID=3101350 RepID=UPI003C7027F7
MSRLKVEYPGAEAAAGPGEANRRDGTQPRRLLGRVVRWGVTAVLLAVFPFILLVRGGVFAYQQWGLEAWPSLAVSAAATVLLLAFYAWAASRRLGAGKRLRKFTIRVAALAAAAFVLYSLPMLLARPSSTLARGSHPTSLHYTSARTTDSSMRWIFAPSTDPNGGTCWPNWRSGRWASTRSATWARPTICMCP